MKRLLGALMLVALLALGGAADAQPARMIERPPPPPGLVVETGLAGYFDVLPGASRELVATVRNEGNETLALAVRAMELAPPDAPRHLELRLSTDALTLAPGENATLALNVSANVSAPDNATSNVVLMFSRESPSQMLDARVPVRIGESCPSCVPPTSFGPMGGVVFTSGGSAGASDVFQAPAGSAPRANGTRATPVSPGDDPALETPGPGVALAALALGTAALGRRARSVGILIALLALAPAALAAGERSFAVTSVARDGDDALVTLAVTYGTPSYTIVTLVDAQGRLLAPEVAKQNWYYAESATLRFPDINATDVEVRIHYYRGTVEIDEAIPLRLPAVPAARFDVVEVATSPSDALALTLANVGDAASGALTAHLEDPAGKRIGAPLALSVPALAAGARANLAFQLARPTTNVRLVIEHANGTERFDIELPAAANEARLELVQATAFPNGTAEFAVAHLSGDALDEVIAHLESGGRRIGEPPAFYLGRLEAGNVARARFALSDETSEVTLVLEHEAGTRWFNVTLAEGSGASDGSGSDVALETELPSRDGQVGETATYDLKLANEGNDDALVDLRVEGLPEGYAATFSVGGSAARALVVPEGEARALSLVIAIPQAASRDAGRALPFDVVASVAGAEVARTSLTLAVEGAPRLELAGQNWFATAEPGAATNVRIAIRNTGSAVAQDIDMAVSSPAGWRVTFSPTSIESLAPGATRDVDVTIEAPADAGAGRYVLDISASAADASARARSLSIEIAQESSSRLGWLVGAGLAGLVATVLIVKLRRR